MTSSFIATDELTGHDCLCIDVVGTITSEKAGAIVAALAAAPHAREIEIIVDSSGGEYWAAHEIHVRLRKHPARRKVALVDRAESAALLPVLACDERIARASSVMLLHQPTLPLSGSFGADELRELAGALDWLADEMAGVIAERTGSPRTEIAKEMGSEFPTSLDRALELGILTEVVR